MLRWLKTVVVSDEEKASLETSGGGREGERKRIAVEVSKLVLDGIRTGTGTRFQDKSGGYPDCWPGGARHVGDASPICCSHMERGKAGLDTAAGDRAPWRLPGPDFHRQTTTSFRSGHDRWTITS